MAGFHKPTHLDAGEMFQVLEKIGPEGFRAAFKLLKGGKPFKHREKFLPAIGWVVVDDEGEQHAHRPLISLAYQEVGGKALQPNNFGEENDRLCKTWFESHFGKERVVLV